MGVFLYSNNKINTEKVEDVLITRGHKDIKNFLKGDNSTLIIAPKILVKNENYICGEELGCKDDYVVGIGTYFYKGEYGKTALKLMYEDLDTVLSENPVYGHYAFCIHKNGATYIFNDMSGFMRLYVYEEDGQIVVSSSHTAVLATIKNPKIDKVRFAGFIGGNYGREEGYAQGLILNDPLKYIVIKDRNSPERVRKPIEKVKRIETLDEAVEYVSSLFKEQMNEIKSAVGEERIYTDLTGGLDSRLIASNLRASDFNFEFINYPIFGPDAEIANIISKGLDKKLFVQTNQPIGEDFTNHYGEFDFGNNFFRQYPNPRWTLENKFEFSGARGECIDLPDIYADEKLSMMSDARISSLVPKLCLNSIISERYKKKYVEYMVNFVSERTGINPEKGMSEYEQVKFTQFIAGQFGDSNYNSAAQAHCYFYSLYNEWHFNHYISDIAFDAKSCRRLTIALIKKIDPILGSFPFVSRRRTRRNSVNEVSELPMKYRSYNGIKSMLPKFFVNYIYGKMGRRFKEDLFNSIDINIYADLFDIKELKAHMNLYSDVLNRLYSVDKIVKHFKIAID